MTNYPFMGAFVRIGPTNKAIRINKIGVGTAVQNLPEGVYWSGMNGNAAFAAYADSAIIADVPSLMEAFHTLTDINTQIDQETGHVSMGRGGLADVIYWGHASTTVDPQWFGQRRSAGVYANTTLPAAPFLFLDMSQIASSLVAPSYLRPLRVDLPASVVGEVTRESGTFKKYSMWYAKMQQRIIEFRLNGVPRADEDTSYHAYRRFLQSLAQGGCTKQFFLIPNPTITGNPAALDQDDASENRRYGFERLTLNREQDVSFKLGPLFPGHYQHWAMQLQCDTWV